MPRFRRKQWLSQVSMSSLASRRVASECVHLHNCRLTFKILVLFDSPAPPQSLQLHITVSPEKVKINVDCQEVAEKPIKAAKNITLDGYEVLGKMVKSGGGRRQSATVSEKAKGF